LRIVSEDSSVLNIKFINLFVNVINILNYLIKFPAD
jgi:hypothetical protein